MKYFKPCLGHDYEKMTPAVTSSYIPNLVSVPTPVGSGIIPELGTVRDSIRIPQSDVHLIYRSTSSSSPSTIDIKFTPAIIPPTLMAIHLNVKISGVSFSKSFEADSNLTYVYQWTKRNVYNQKVYGICMASVSVGYEYSDCGQTIWKKLTVELRGFDVDISKVGGWNLDIHHHYNMFQGNATIHSIHFMIHIFWLQRDRIQRKFKIVLRI